jgi:hypothetical protein
MQRILVCTKIKILGLMKVQEAKLQILKNQMLLVQAGERLLVMISCSSDSVGEKKFVSCEDSQNCEAVRLLLLPLKLKYVII